MVLSIISHIADSGLVVLIEAGTIELAKELAKEITEECIKCGVTVVEIYVNCEVLGLESPKVYE